MANETAISFDAERASLNDIPTSSVAIGCDRVGEGQLGGLLSWNWNDG